MSENKCFECEQDCLINCAEAECKLQKAENLIRIYEKCLDIKDELCKALRDDNYELKNKIRILEEIKQ